MRILYLELAFQDCSLALYYLNFLYSPPSSLQIRTFANKHGGVRGELVNITNRTGDSMANDALFSIGG